MIAFAIAAALFADPGSLERTALAAPVRPTPEPIQVASAPVLQSVAVTLECTAYADGHVGACRVLDETHPGMGFGEAAIALMRDAEAEPGPRDVRFARTIQFMP
jgi:hypothetical protein